ncbi:MAG: S-layer homology domain-containing protein [Clostridia bacterium]|nr:S-layer homology domain-containing protein [Clostridia bacterium]
MRNKIITVFLAIGMTAASCTSALAAGILYDIVYDYDNSKITLTGNYGSEESTRNITTVALKNGLDYGDVDYKDIEDDILYLKQTGTVDGKYTFTIDTTGGKGLSKAYISADGEKDRTLLELIILDKDALKDALARLNSAAKTDDDGVEFINVIAADKNALGFEYDLADKTDAVSAVKKYREYVKANELSITDNELIAKSYRTFIIAQALSDNDISDISDYMGDLMLDTELVSDCEEVCGDKEVVSQYLTGKMCGKGIDDAAEFETEIKKALILTTVKYGDGYGSIVSCLNKYGSVIGITGTINEDACSSLAGGDYNTADDFAKAYKDYKATSNTPTVSNGPGGKGKNNTNVGSNVSVPVVNPAQNMSAVTAVFDDIEGLDWAHEAIIALKDKNIINGVGENRFHPNDPIKREEFIKILVLAMNMRVESNATVFADVPEGTWYCDVVNTAYAKGICKGQSDTIFGTGENITRQDMCVMLYNALKFKNAGLASKELAFEDSDTVSPYAVEALMALYGEGAINGVSDTEFAPFGTATRAQAAKVVYAVLNKLQQ